jgi:hypothetical protein
MIRLVEVGNRDMSHLYLYFIPSNETLAEGHLICFTKTKESINPDCIGRKKQKIMDDSDNSDSDSDNDHQLQNEDEDEDEDDRSLTEEERIAAAAATERSRLMTLKLISILERKVTYPARTIKKIDDLVDYFCEGLEFDVQEMLLENNPYPYGDFYRGLDSSRETEAEVEAIVRVFPIFLTGMKGVWIRGDVCFFCPIQLLTFEENSGSRRCSCNVKAVSFIHLFARLAIEFGLFEEEYRGGLLFYDNDSDNNVLQYLMLSNMTEIDNREHHEYIDGKYLQVLIQLRQMGYFIKEDIQSHGLLTNLCSQLFFAEKRFRLLVEWDPNVLLNPDRSGDLPLHDTAPSTCIRGFQLVFEYGIRYFPKKKGINILFRKNNNSKTPFQLACENFGYEEVMKVVEDTLIRYSDTPINITEALIMSAIDENIHLDCVYFLLRRDPDVLHKLLSSSTTTTTTTSVAAHAVAAGTNNNNNNSNNLKLKLRKRKRGSKIMESDLP